MTRLNLNHYVTFKPVAPLQKTGP